MLGTQEGVWEEPQTETQGEKIATTETVLWRQTLRERLPAASQREWFGMDLVSGAAQRPAQHCAHKSQTPAQNQQD